MTAYRRILAAIDLTQDSRVVAARACEIARAGNGIVQLLRIVATFHNGFSRLADFATASSKQKNPFGNGMNPHRVNSFPQTQLSFQRTSVQ